MGYPRADEVRRHPLDLDLRVDTNGSGYGADLREQIVEGVFTEVSSPPTEAAGGVAYRYNGDTQVAGSNMYTLTLPYATVTVVGGQWKTAEHADPVATLHVAERLLGL